MGGSHNTVLEYIAGRQVSENRVFTSGSEKGHRHPGIRKDNSLQVEDLLRAGSDFRSAWMKAT